MRTSRLFGRLGLFALTGLVLGAWGHQSEAKVVNLKAVEYVKTLPNGTDVTMWGFVQTDNTGAPLPDAVPSSPGPDIVVGRNDVNLIIRLFNDLPVGADAFVADATSVVAPGLQAVTTNANLAPPAPVTFTDASGRPRIRSLTQETAQGGSRVYRFKINNPGSYLYHSGTHMSVQVPMGLYGAIKKDSGVREAYAGVPYDNEVMVVYSEIDEHLHTEVANRNYVPFGDPVTQLTSTIRYNPVAFMVNGSPFDPAAEPPLDPASMSPYGAQGFDGGIAGQRTLVRFYNLGSKTRMPVLNGGSFEAVAEDGKPYANVKKRVALQLAAGQTRDVILDTGVYGVYTLFDRALGLSNSDGTAGGLYAKFVVHDDLRSQPMVYDVVSGILRVRGWSDNTITPPGFSSPVSVTAWGLYDAGTPVLLGDVAFLNHNNNNGRTFYQSYFDLAAIGSGIARPDRVLIISSLGGQSTRVVTDL